MLDFIENIMANIDAKASEMILRVSAAKMEDWDHIYGLTGGINARNFVLFLL